MSREHCPVCGAHVSEMCIHVNRLVDAILHGAPDNEWEDHPYSSPKRGPFKAGEPIPCATCGKPRSAHRLALN